MKALKKRIEKYQGESIKELKFSNFNLHVLNEGLEGAFIGKK